MIVPLYEYDVCFFVVEKDVLREEGEVVVDTINVI